MRAIVYIHNKRMFIHNKRMFIDSRAIQDVPIKFNIYTIINTDIQSSGLSTKVQNPTNY